MINQKSDEEFAEEMRSSNEFTEECKQWCLVYDNQTGKVVNTCEYVPLSRNNLLSKQELEKMAIKYVPQKRKYNIDSLSTFHPKQSDIDLIINKVDLEPMMRYKINLESCSLVSEHMDIDIETSGEKKG